MFFQLKFFILSGYWISVVFMRWIKILISYFNFVNALLLISSTHKVYVKVSEWWCMIYNICCVFPLIYRLWNVKLSIWKSSLKLLYFFRWGSFVFCFLTMQFFFRWSYHRFVSFFLLFFILQLIVLC